MDDDFLLFDDDDEEGAGLPVNILAVGVPAADSDALTVRARAARTCADYAGASMVIFEDAEGEFSNADVFARAMRTSELPTLDQASAWLAARRSAVDAVVWAAAGDG
jgi:hypothetical protein